MEYSYLVSPVRNNNMNNNKQMTSRSFYLISKTYYSPLIAHSLQNMATVWKLISIATKLSSC